MTLSCTTRVYLGTVNAASYAGLCSETSGQVCRGSTTACTASHNLFKPFAESQVFVCTGHMSLLPRLTQCLLHPRGVEYPKLYAEGTNAVSVRFNCTQRAHQNTLENLPVFLIMQILLAQAYPMLASALGVAWAVGETMFHVLICAKFASSRLVSYLRSCCRGRPQNREGLEFGEYLQSVPVLLSTSA